MYGFAPDSSATFFYTKYVKSSGDALAIIEQTSRRRDDHALSSHCTSPSRNRANAATFLLAENNKRGWLMRTLAAGAVRRNARVERRESGAQLKLPKPRSDLHLSAMINAAGLSALLWAGLYHLILG